MSNYVELCQIIAIICIPNYYFNFFIIAIISINHFVLSYVDCVNYFV